MSALQRIDAEIERCSQRLRALVPRDGMVLRQGEGDALRPRIQPIVAPPPPMPMFKLKLRGLNAVLESSGYFERLRQIVQDAAESEKIIGVFRTRMRTLMASNILDQAAGERFMEIVRTMIVSMVVRMLPGENNSARMIKFLKIAEVWFRSLTVDENLICFFDRLAERISSLFVLAYPAVDQGDLYQRRDLVARFVAEMRSTEESVPMHSQFFSELKVVLCGDRLPGSALGEGACMVGPFTEFDSPNSKMVLRLWYFMDLFIGMRGAAWRKELRDNMGMDVVIGILYSELEDMLLSNEACDMDLKKVCVVVKKTIQRRRFHFNGNTTPDEKFRIILNGVHRGLVALAMPSLQNVLPVFDRCMKLSLWDVQQDLVAHGFSLYDGRESRVLTRFSASGEQITATIIETGGTITGVNFNGATHTIRTATEWITVLHKFALALPEMPSPWGELTALDNEMPSPWGELTALDHDMPEGE